jgi:hypothetical protein
MWRDLFYQKPEYEWKTTDGPVFAVEQLEEAVHALGAEIPTSVQRKLDTWLTEQTECWSAIFNMVRAYHDLDRPWDHELCARAREDSRPSIQVLADQASRDLPGLKAWYQLAVAVGDYEVTIFNLPPSKPVPSVAAIVASALALPKEALEALPIAAAITRLAPELSALGPLPFLARAVEAVDESARSTTRLEGLEVYEASQLVHKLDRLLQHSLQTIRLTPRWDKDRGELWVGDQLARRVRPIAINIILVLDSFQEESWPPAIYDPLPGGNDTQRRHETIRSLNGGSRLIRFRGDGTNERITWEFE